MTASVDNTRSDEFSALLHLKLCWNTDNFKRLKKNGASRSKILSLRPAVIKESSNRS